jgi:hypothetical protein
LRWTDVDLEGGVLKLSPSILRDGARTVEKDTKTHQHRRVTLDPETVAVLTEHWERCGTRAAALGLDHDRRAFVFSPAPDGCAHPVPGSARELAVSPLLVAGEASGEVFVVLDLDSQEAAAGGALVGDQHVERRPVSGVAGDPRGPATTRTGYQ